MEKKEEPVNISNSNNTRLNEEENVLKKMIDFLEKANKNLIKSEIKVEKDEINKYVSEKLKVYKPLNTKDEDNSKDPDNKNLHLYKLFKDMDDELLNFFMERKDKKENKENEGKINKQKENKLDEQTNGNKSKKENDDKISISNIKEDIKAIDLRKLVDMNVTHSKNPPSLSFKNKNIEVQKLKDIKSQDPKAQQLPGDEKKYFLQQVLLDKDDIKKLNYDSFCNAFFMVSFKNIHLLEKYEKINSFCLHDYCSMLPAIIPELIYSYQKKNGIKMELDNNIASLCFPNGLKLCYGDKYENSIRTVRNYRFLLSNEKGERFFVVTYHFYLRMSNNDFENLNKDTPMKKQLKSIFNDFYLNVEKKDGEENNLIENCKNLINKKYIYKPFCICLVSKYPFIKQMETCLESIRFAIENNIKEEELNKLISYIVESIPAPPQNSKILFPLPYNSEFVEIQPPYFNDMRSLANDPLIILEYLSNKEIILLLKLILLEKNILIIGNFFDDISRIILNLISLIYPFEYNYLCLPVFSEKYFGCFSSIHSFIIGMNKSLNEKAIEYIKIKSEKQKMPTIFIFDINEPDENKKIRIMNDQNKKAQKINEMIPKFSKEIEDTLLQGLKNIKNDYQNSKDNKFEYNLRIKHLFLYVFALIFKDYRKHTVSILNENNYFSKCFFDDKKSEDKENFVELFTDEGQIFNYFLTKANNNKNLFFDKYITELKKSNNIDNLYNNYFKKEYLQFLKVDKAYFIKPFFIEEFENYDKSNKLDKSSLTLNNLSFYISHKFEKIKKSIVPQELVGRIVYSPFELNKDKDPEEFYIFLMPGQDVNKLIINKSEKKKISKKMNEKEEGINDDIKEIFHKIHGNKIQDATLKNCYRDMNKIIEDKENGIFGIELFIDLIYKVYSLKREIKIINEITYKFLKDNITLIGPKLNNEKMIQNF